MLLCDDEPSPVSSDEVFFICEKQTSTDRDCVKNENEDDKNDDDNDDDADDDNDGDSASETRSGCDDTKNKTKKNKKKTAINRLNRIIGNKKSVEGISDDTNPRESENKAISTERVKEAGCQTPRTIFVKIEVENCSQCPEKSISMLTNEAPSIDKDMKNTCKMKKKTVAVQVNFNSIESVVESHCVKISKLRCCNKAALLQNSMKMKKNEASSEKTIDGKTSIDSTKIYLWGGKSSKRKQQQQQQQPPPLLKSQSVIEKPARTSSGSSFAFHEPLQKSNSLVEKTSLKSKKSTIGCSPLKKLNRSSLTIEPDKITINLSKYSPCASRLAASSKILTSDSPLSPESPLQAVRSKSPRRRDFHENDRLDPNRQMEKSSLQASLSLNIQQYQKSHPTPRSRSVGDSCVTSPTSEATTLSYSPTGTEILSLEEVGPQIIVNDVNIDDSIMALQKHEIRDKFNDDYIACSRKANLETKC